MARDFVTGLLPDGAAPMGQQPSACDPSRGDLIKSLQRIMTLDDLSDVFAEAQNALDRLPEAKTMRIADLANNSAAVRYDAVNWLEGHLDADTFKALQSLYLVETNKTVRTLLKDVLIEHAQGIEARQGRDEGSACESPIGLQSDAPDPSSAALSDAEGEKP